MNATQFTLDKPAWTGVGAIRIPADPAAEVHAEPKVSLMERFDRWLWQQHVREREAYLAESKDIFELEERIRRLERSIGGRYY